MTHPEAWTSSPGRPGWTARRPRRLSSSSNSRGWSSPRTGSTGRSLREGIRMVARPREELVVDVATGDDEDDGARDVVELPQGRQRGGGCALDPDSGVGIVADGERELSLGDQEHAARGLAQDLDGERNGAPDGKAVRERRAAVGLDGTAGVPALDHDGGPAGRGADPERLGRALA